VVLVFFFSTSRERGCRLLGMWLGVVGLRSTVRS
jgi:hypothetical protein